VRMEKVGFGDRDSGRNRNSLMDKGLEVSWVPRFA
jgi:hypothetical protein